MKTLFYLGFFTFLISCKKDSISQFDNNQLKATIYFQSGDIKTFEVNGSEAHIGCMVTGMKYIEGRSMKNENISLFPSGGCQIQKGIFNGLSCDYSPNWNVNKAEYRCSGVFNPGAGSITYIVVDGNYTEGTFEAICTKADIIVNPLNINDTTFIRDTVIVKGNFKGISEN